MRDTVDGGRRDGSFFTPKQLVFGIFHRIHPWIHGQVLQFFDSDEYSLNFQADSHLIVCEGGVLGGLEAEELNEKSAVNEHVGIFLVDFVQIDVH